MRVFLYKTANPRFFGALGGTPVFQLPAAWAGTVLKHFPLAFFRNMFAAAPFARWAFRRPFAVKSGPPLHGLHLQPSAAERPGGL